MRVNGTDVVISFTLTEALQLLNELERIADPRVTCNGHRLCEFRMLLDQTLREAAKWRKEDDE